MSLKECQHCGTRYEPAPSKPEGFCCNGCAQVYNLIQSEGFTQYYELRNQPIPPAGAIPLQPRSFRWLEEKQIAAESAQAKGSLSTAGFHLQGISCLACVWLIEQLFQRHPGAVRAIANPQRAHLQLQWKTGQCDLAAFARELQSHGYLLNPPDFRQGSSRSRELTGRLALSGAFALNGMLFTLPRYLGMATDFSLAGLFSLLTILFATLSLVVGGSYFISRAWQSTRKGLLHMDLPISIGVLIAYIGSLIGWMAGHEEALYFDFVCVFTFLMLVGRWLQERAIEHNQNQVNRNDTRPSTIIRLTPEGPEEVPVESIQVGDEVEVPPGELCPVSGTLTGNQAAFTLEWINGESDPRFYNQGMSIPGGARSISQSPVHLIVSEKWSKSLLAELTETRETDPQSQTRSRILPIYILLVIGFAVTGWSFWALAMTDFSTAWQVALSILVISCPCAIGLALPLANELATGILRRRGIFVKDDATYRYLSQVQTILFDKTGTLTMEIPALENPETLDQIGEPDRSALRWMVDSSLHPLSRSIREHLARNNPRPAPSTDPVEVEEHVGSGLTLRCGSNQWTLGKADWNASPADFRSLKSDANKHDVVFSRNGKALAHLRFRDDLRDHAQETIEKLKKNFAIRILSGDRPEKVRQLCIALGLPESDGTGAMSPQDKAAQVARLPARSTLFIGDGANDSLAFDQALIRGTPVVDRGVLGTKADFFILSRGLNCLLDLFRIGRLRARATQTVFSFAVCYNLIAIAVCLGGHMNPLLAAILMPSSSLVTLAIVGAFFKAPLRG